MNTRSPSFTERMLTTICAKTTLAQNSPFEITKLVPDYDAVSITLNQSPLLRIILLKCSISFQLNEKNWDHIGVYE